MTISSTTTPRTQYSGNGVTTAFSTVFIFNTSSDLRVVLTDGSGTDTTLTITTHYTITGGSGSTGTVTMITPPASGEFLTIYRATAKTQSVDYITNDAFPAALHEAALDRLTLISQELSYDLSRSILNSVTSGVTDIVFPSPTASTVIGWNSAGDTLVNYALLATGNYAIGAGTGILVSNVSATSAIVRTLTGTTNEITITNGTGVSGNPTVGLASTVDMTGKTVKLKDSTLTIEDNSDATKKVAFECSGITTATTRTLTIPNASGTIALTTDVTNEYADDVFRVKDNSDTTKKVAFECSGITTATTRTLTVPNASGTIALTSDITTVSAAAQSDQETATSTTTYVSPGRQQYHPSAAKAWLKCNAAGTIQVSNNITSITDDATGKVTVTIATDFSSGDFTVHATAFGSVCCYLNSQAAGSVTVWAETMASAFADPTNYYIVMFGDQ